MHGLGGGHSKQRNRLRRSRRIHVAFTFQTFGLHTPSEGIIVHGEISILYDEVPCLYGGAPFLKGFKLKKFVSAMLAK